MTKTTALWFDMDGTIANLYGVDNWLNCLINKDATPYEIAKPMVQMNLLARLLNQLQVQGYKIGIISWLAKNSTPEYDEKVTKANKKCLKKHLASVRFDEIHIVPYGTPKFSLANTKNDYLFDDEENNLNKWQGKSIQACKIMETLRELWL